MNQRFSIKPRIVMCERCQRPVAATLAVCPHCDHHRLPAAAYVPRLTGPTGSIVRSPVQTIRVPLRVIIVFAMALLALSGYVSLRESGLDSRLEALPAHRWLGSLDEWLDRDEERNLLSRVVTQAQWQVR
jgi:hypothetical protein